MALTPVFWLTESLESVPDDDSWISPREQRLLAELRFPKRRAEWRLGRWTAKRALAVRLGIGGVALAELEVLPADDGAPQALRRGAELAVTLSLSHRRTAGLCVLGGQKVQLGCDLELVEPRSARFVEDYFTEAEVSYVQGAAEAERPLLANLIWSAKESALKAVREGLRRDTRSVEVTITQRAGSSRSWRELVVQDRQSGDCFPGWWCKRGDDELLTVVASPAPASPEQLSSL